MIRKRRHVPTPQSFAARIQRPFIRLRNLARQANSSLRFRTPQRQTAAYEVWNKRLPVTSKVLEQIRSLAKSGEPFSGLLVSTHPVTMRMTQDGATPIVTRLIVVKDLVPPNFSGIDCKDLVATFHTHHSRLDVLEHDERLFRIVDAFAGPKIHIIASVRGLRFYSARGGPALVTRDRNVEVR
jgi:hypothetical protein